MVMGVALNPEEERERHRQGLVEDADTARWMMARIAELGTEGICGLAIDIGSGAYYDMSCRKGHTATLCCCDHLGRGERGMAMHPDDKWIRRPIPDERVADIKASLMGALEAIAADGDPDGNEEGRPSLSRFFPGTVMSVEYPDGTPVMGRLREGHDTAMGRLAETLRSVFRSVSPPPQPDYEGKLRDHLATMSYTAVAFLGSGRDSIIARRDADGQKPSLSVEATEHYADETGELVGTKRELPFSLRDWGALVDALIDADLPHWGPDYRNEGVCDGWGVTLRLSFDDGWEMSVSGSNRWDSRCLPIVGFLVDRGISEAEVMASVGELRHEEELLQRMRQQIRETAPGKAVCLREGEEPLSDYEWDELIGTVRMRSLSDGLLVCDASVVEDDSQDDLGTRSRWPSFPSVADSDGDGTAPGTDGAGDGDEQEPTGTGEDGALRKAIDSLRRQLAEGEVTGTPFPKIPIRPHLAEPSEGEPEVGSAPSRPSFGDRPRRMARAVVRPVRGLPEGMDGRTVESLFLHVRNRQATADMDWSAPREPISADDGRSIARNKTGLLMALRQMEGVEWNDPSDIVWLGCTWPLVMEMPDKKKVPRDASPWYAEVVWDDGSVSFAHADEIPDGSGPLLQLMASLMLHG